MNTHDSSPLLVSCKDAIGLTGIFIGLIQVFKAIQIGQKVRKKLGKTFNFTKSFENFEKKRIAIFKEHSKIITQSYLIF